MDEKSPEWGKQMAAGEGFEPSHTESESAVLPLHNPAVFHNKGYYTRLTGNVKACLKIFFISFPEELCYNKMG